MSEQPNLPEPSNQPPSLWTEDGKPRSGSGATNGYAVVTPGPSTSVMGVLAVIFGALSFMSCPILFAVVALVLAHSSAKEIRASGGRISGEGLVTAARVLAWINIGLFVLFALIFFVWFLAVLILGGAGAP